MKIKETKTELTFANVLAVVDYLKAHDWKVAKSLVYLHKKEGKLRPRKDGLFYLTDVNKYAANYLKRIDGSSGSEADQFQADKFKTELNISKEKLEHLQLKNKVASGLYVPRDSFERELAHRAMVFKNDIEAFCRSQAGVIVSMVGGEKDRVPDLVEYLLSAAAGWLNRYAADREFIVPVPGPAGEEILRDDPDEDFDDGEE
jgi:hypothetical protein